MCLVSVTSASHLLPKSCCDGKQALLALLVDGACKFDQELLNEVKG